MSYQLELIGQSGKFKIYQVRTEEIETSGILSGTTGTTLDNSRIEARGQVVIDRRDIVRTKEKRGGEIRFS